MTTLKDTKVNNPKMYRFENLIKSESGSISLLIIGFFIAALSALMVTTDIAVVANAKRSLDQATEAAAMRAVHNIDEAEYYKGKHTILTSLWEIYKGGTWADNRIPIDCNKGRAEVASEFNSWIGTTSNLKTLQIKSYEVKAFQCEYDTIHLETSAVVNLPFPAPFSNFDKAEIRSSITTTNMKDKGFYLFGKRTYWWG